MMSLAVDERRDLLEFLRALTPDEWESPSLCNEWRVRDVVAHIVSYEGLRPEDVARRFITARLSLAAVNRTRVDELRRRAPAELMTLLEQNLRPSGLTTAFGGRVALTDSLIHHQDIRRPLGRPREIPTERLRQVLSFALVALPIRGAWRLRGVRAVATDLDWSHGVGPEVRGSGEAILMTMAGRRGIAHELEGPGARRLAQRLG